MKKSMKKLKECPSCAKFRAKFKTWNEAKVPSVALVTVYKCTKCGRQFDTYKDMIFVWDSSKETKTRLA